MRNSRIVWTALSSLLVAVSTAAAPAGSPDRAPDRAPAADGRTITACHPGTGEPAKRRALVKLYAAAMPAATIAVAGAEHQAAGALETKVIVAEQGMLDVPQVSYSEVVREGKTMTCAHLVK